MGRVASRRQHEDFQTEVEGWRAGMNRSELIKAILTGETVVISAAVDAYTLIRNDMSPVQDGFCKYCWMKNRTDHIHDKDCVWVLIQKLEGSNVSSMR